MPGWRGNSKALRDMENDRFRRVDELFQQARVLPPEQRTRFLLEAAFGNVDLQREVEDLLRRADAPPPAFADDRIGSAARARYFSAVGAAAAAAGTRFGPFEVFDLVGEGGMGTVYRARQDVPDRVVALKVIHPRARSAETIRRFHVEANALGRLQHPNVAQIFVAGAEDHGFGPQPFLAMEYVQGLSLIDHVRAHNLDLAARMDLFIKSARAVGHAHRAGLVHRDIKPANILVTQSGEPKVLDFGIARVVGTDVATTTAHTREGQLLGTLAYMSPEQLNGFVDEVGPPSDIYALGIVLYELIEGCTPHQIEGRPLAESIRLLVEEPVPPVTTIAPPFERRMNAIIAQATHRDSARRYESAEAIADDVTRFVGLHPQSTWSRTTPAHRKRIQLTRRTVLAALGTVAILAIAHVPFVDWKDSGNGTAGGNPPASSSLHDDALPPVPFDGSPIEVLDRAHQQWTSGALRDEIAAMRHASTDGLSESDVRSADLALALSCGVAAWFDSAEYGAEAETLLNDWLEDADDEIITGPVAAARITLAWLYLKQFQPQRAGMIFDTVIRAGDTPRNVEISPELVAEARVGRAAALSGPRMVDNAPRVVMLCELGLATLVETPGPRNWRTRRALEAGARALRNVGESERADMWNAHLE